MAYFTKEESAKLNPPPFISNGITRHIVIMGKEEWQAKSGDVYPGLLVAEADMDGHPMDARLVKDFDLMAAIDKYEGEIIEGKTVISITPTVKEGQEGKAFPKHTITIEPTDMSLLAKMVHDKVMNKTSDIKTEEIPF